VVKVDLRAVGQAVVIAAVAVRAAVVVAVTSINTNNEDS